jgi:hypothetical protein
MLTGSTLVAALPMDGSLSLGAGSSTDSYVMGNADSFRSGASHEISSFSLTLRGGFERRSLSGALDFENKYSLSEQANYVHPNEASLSVQLGSTLLRFGRHRELWSETDQVWRRGLWAPRYMEDKLTAEASTLTGITAQWTGGDFTFTAFGSYFNVPELGPKVDVDNGQLVSKNPWFSPPTPSLQLFNQTGTTAVDYQLAPPNIAKLVLQPSVALKVAWQNNNGFVRLAAADKPMNQLAYGFPFTVRTLADRMLLDVDIHVRTVRHRVYTLEAGRHQDGGWHEVVSYTYEEPQSDPVPDDWISQTLTPAQIFAGGLGYDLRRSGPQATFVGLSYANVQTQPARDRGDLASAQSFFESRFEYIHSLKAEVRSPLWMKGAQLLKGSFALLCDFHQQALVYSTALEYWQDRFGASLRSDFFQMIEGQTTAGNDGFLRRYQSNDRISLGMSYVF